MFKQFLNRAKYLPIAGLPIYVYSGNISTYLLNKLDPEFSHDIAIKCLSNNIVPYTNHYKSNKHEWSLPKPKRKFNKYLDKFKDNNLNHKSGIG